MRRTLSVLILTLIFLAGITQVTSAAAKNKPYLVFIGDSRFVGMYNANSGKKGIYIAKRSMGYRWFIEQEEEFRKYDNKKATFVIGLGINDLYHVDDYVLYVNNLNLKGKVYFCQANPVDRKHAKEYGYTVTNKEVGEFNEVLKRNAINYRVLKTNKYLTSKGFAAADGLHYDTQTYRKLYKYIRRHT